MSQAALPVATGHAGRLRRRGGLPALGLVGAWGMRGARTGLACGAAPGDPEPRTRTGRLPAGRAATWPPPASRALRKLRIPSGPPAAALDPAVVQAARRDPVARGGREAEPDQQARGEARGGSPRNPHPRRHLLTTRPGRRTSHPTGPPPRPTSQHQT
jgi:hypothetical protein